MSPKSHVPQEAFTVQTYQELDRFINAFASGKLNLLIVVGKPGLQKTRAVKDVLRDDGCWIDGNATAFGIYCKLSRHIDEPVIIDDVDSLYADPSGVRLLKSLCQTERRKRVAWNSQTTAIRHGGPPSEFFTESHVLIIANDWKTLNRNVLAVQDRGHVVFFDPTPLEVHLRVSHWFQDQEVYDFVADCLRRNLIGRPTMRMYVKALELKKAGMEWRRCILASSGLNPTKILIAQLRADPSFRSEAERVREFMKRSGKSRATYFNNLKAISPKMDVPHVVLKDDSSTRQADILRLLRQRHTQIGEG